MSDRDRERLFVLVDAALEELEEAGSHHKNVSNHYERIGNTKFLLCEVLKELEGTR